MKKLDKVASLQFTSHISDFLPSRLGMWRDNISIQKPVFSKNTEGWFITRIFVVVLHLSKNYYSNLYKTFLLSIINYLRGETTFMCIAFAQSKSISEGIHIFIISYETMLSLWGHMKKCFGA